MNLVSLRDSIEKTFNIAELRGLCFRLNIRFENLSGDTLSQKTLSLVEYSSSRGRLEDLVDELRNLRPKEMWPDVDTLFFKGSNKWDIDQVFLSMVDNPRHSIYLNENRVKEAYDQIESFVPGGSAYREEKPIVLAHILEHGLKHLGKLIETPVDNFPKRSWIKHFGNAYFTHPRSPINISNENPDIVKTIEDEREKQDLNTYVLAFFNKIVLASIASEKHGRLAGISINPAAEIGIFGFYEKQIKQVTFITPYWIWY